MESEETLCNDCLNRAPRFKIARAVGPYNDDRLRIAVKVLKFMGRRYLAGRMGDLMAGEVGRENRFWPLDVIIPVPSSPANTKRRGFNQAELLARQIGKRLALPVLARGLLRIKDTPSQRELTREERERNLLCAFRVNEAGKIEANNILLVDDVYTTGSTIRECTRTLLDAEAADVSVITWATGKGF